MLRHSLAKHANASAATTVVHRNASIPQGFRLKIEKANIIISACSDASEYARIEQLDAAQLMR